MSIRGCLAWQHVGRGWVLAVALALSGGALAEASMAADPSATGPSEWTAQWIGRNDPATRPALGQQAPAPLLRKEFTVKRGIADARLRIVGLGYYVAWINGRRVGDQVLDPGPTQYVKTAVYRSFNVTGLLRRGQNAVGVMLGRGYFSATTSENALFGWGARPDWHEPRLLAQLDVTYRDGSTDRVTSDGSWQMANGPITDELYFGEHYDARLAHPGWTEPGYDSSRWTSAPVQPSPTQHVVEATMPPVEVTGNVRQVAVMTPRPGVRVYDFGVMYAGWARIVTRGAAGTTITLIYGETLNSDGTVNQQDPQSHLDSYTLGGQGLETWEPSFTRHPLRYVQVSFSPSAPEFFSIQGRIVHNAVASTGVFESSNRLLNQIEGNQRRSVLNNLWGIPTDTPWRDRQGWTADAWLYMDSAIDNFGMKRFFEQWLQDYRDSQGTDGSLPSVAPAAFGSGIAALGTDPSWSGTFIFDSWRLYQQYGDPTFLTDNYATAKRWMDLMASTIAPTGYVYKGFSFGDWAAPGSEANNAALLSAPEGSGLTAPGVPLVTANGDLYEEARTLAEIARALGNPTDATTYDVLADRIEQAFNATFFNSATDTYQNSVPAGYRQTSNLVPLYYGLVPAGHEQAVYDKLIADIHARGDHLNTGAVGTKMLLPVLTAHGDTDLAYKIATQTTYPSWGYWVSQGATTSWETWSHTGPIQSLDHAFLGTINDWLYNDVAGITPAAPGFARILIRPTPPAGLDRAASSEQTVRGLVAASWRRVAHRLGLKVEIPRGSTAEVDVPVVEGGTVRVASGRGVRYLRTEGGYAIYAVDSGRHRFDSVQ
jgi:alpha-L-rhamnosidase